MTIAYTLCQSERSGADFKKPVTVKDIEHRVNNPKEPRGVYFGIGNKMKLKPIKKY